jgi:hypothetical protein
MKPLTIEQQQEAIRIIKGFANHVNNKLNDHINLTDSAKRFANSLETKYYIVRFQEGTRIHYIEQKGVSSVYVENARVFKTIDEAEFFMDKCGFDNDKKYILIED